ncbi:MAG: NAD(P)-binding domain-containing protein [Clostridiaceae bacterium]|nr:NAD(P)-binding domain-containing protein [Clostridiaceae bacterium]
MRLGFIGTGIITTAVVTGFCESRKEDLHIIVSPRNKERAAALHEKYPEIVTVAESNQEVIDQSDWVFAALLPQHAEAVLSELTFPPEKKFINLVMTLSTKRAEEIIGKRDIIADVVPLTFAANGFGPVVIYPAIPEVGELMSLVGTPVLVETPKQIAILRSTTGLMSAYYMLLTVLIDWCQENGLDEPSARPYITSFTEAMSKKAATWEGPLENLAREMTPGGINWMALTHLEETEAYKPWTEILDPILKRVIKE